MAPWQRARPRRVSHHEKSQPKRSLQRLADKPSNPHPASLAHPASRNEVQLRPPSSAEAPTRAAQPAATAASFPTPGRRAVGGLGRLRPLRTPDTPSSRRSAAMSGTVTPARVTHRYTDLAERALDHDRGCRRQRRRSRVGSRTPTADMRGEWPIAPVLYRALERSILVVGLSTTRAPPSTALGTHVSTTPDTQIPMGRQWPRGCSTRAAPARHRA